MADTTLDDVLFGCSSDLEGPHVLDSESGGWFLSSHLAELEGYLQDVVVKELRKQQHSSSDFVLYVEHDPEVPCKRCRLIRKYVKYTKICNWRSY